MKQWFMEMFKTYLGPALVAACIIGGYWAYNTIDAQAQALEQMRIQTTELSQVLSGQCTQMLESQGFSVEKVEEKVEE
jgi:hypothetical protein